MSFELLDFVNGLISEETQELSSKLLVAETDKRHLPSDERVTSFRTITHKAMARHRKARLTNYKAEYEIYMKSESSYLRALAALPKSVNEMFQQIVSIVTSGKETILNDWTMAHRNEALGKDKDEELKKIWIRLHMLGFIEDESRS